MDAVPSAARLPAPLDDGARSPDPGVCPFLRIERGDRLDAPSPIPDPAHRCVAIGDPAPQSHRQQQLVCLQPAHANCPRYLRGAVAVAPAAPVVRAASRIPAATLASLLFLVLAAGVSFGFVLQRGSLDLVADAPTPGASVAVVVTPAPTEAPTGAPGSPAPATEPPAVTPEPSVSAEPATPAPSPEPSATTGASPAPTSDRYASLQPCPDRDGCWIYVVQAGNNLFSIASYYGHPLDTILEWNPWITDPSIIRAGDEIRMPPPTR